MSRSITALVGLLLAAGILSACQETKTVGMPQPLPLMAQMTGEDPGLKQPAVLLITTAEQLKATGSQDLARKSIDFNKNSLLVLAAGERKTSGYWASITGAQLRGNELFVQGLVNKPGPADLTAQVVTYPYAAALIAKVSAGTMLRPEIDSATGRAKPVEKPLSPPAPAAPAAPAKKTN